MWLPDGKVDGLRRKLLALTADQRTSMTWQEAVAFAPDTLMLATLGGLKSSGHHTPFQAIASIWNLEDQQ